MKHVTYITTNLINGKQYVGDHSTNNLNDSYLGSGKLIKKAIKKYGKENFKKEILEFCDNKKEAFGLQEKYINKFDTLNPNGYNISPKGGHDVGGSLSKETKIKISNSLKKTYKENPELIENLREKATGRKWTSEMKNNIKGRKSHRKGISIEEEYGDKANDIRNKLKKPKSDEAKKKYSAAAKGRKLSDKTKEKISKSLKGRKVTHNNFGAGENNVNAKLSNDQVLEILDLLNKNEKISIIAKKYNVSVQTIYNIKKGKTRQILK